MKRIILIIAFTTFMSGTINPQVNGSAIGLRAGFDAQEISYQLPLGHVTRFELTF